MNTAEHTQSGWALMVTLLAVFSLTWAIIISLPGIVLP